MQGENVGSLYYDLTVDDSGLNRQLAAADVRIKNFGDGMGARFGQISNQFNGVADGIAAVASRVALLATAGTVGLGAFVKTSADLQTTNAQFQAIIGNTKEANKLFGELYQYTLGKPIAFPDAAKAAQTLLGYGRSAQQVMNDMKTLSAISIVNGADLQQVALAYGQVNAKGGLYGQEVLQLINNKVPIATALAKELGVSVQEVGKRMDGGQISAEVFNRAMANLVPQSKIAEMSNTFNNRIISMQGALRSFGLTILGIKLDPLNGMVIKTGGLFDIVSRSLITISSQLKELGPRIASALQFVIDNGPTFIAIIEAIAVMYVSAKVAAMGFAIASTIATGGLNLIIPVIVAVIGGLAFLYFRFSQVRDAISSVWQTIVAVFAPALNLLWSTLQSQLIPALQNLWTQLGPVLQPVLQALGSMLVGTLVASLYVTAGVLYAMAYAISFVVGMLASLINWIAGAVGWIRNIAGAAAAAVGALFNFGGQAYSAGRGLLEAFGRGLSDAAGGVVSTARAVLNRIRDMLPHSDAKVGPLSDLTASGRKLVETLAKGVNQAEMSLQTAMTSVLMQPNIALATATPTAGVAPSKGGQIINIGTINDKSDADYILRRADRNSELENMGMSPRT